MILFVIMVAKGFQIKAQSTNLLLKFGYSEKATEFEKIFHSKFDVTKWLQILSGRLLSNFVAFSEYPNFSSKNETLLIF